MKYKQLIDLVPIRHSFPIMADPRTHPSIGAFGENRLLAVFQIARPYGPPARTGRTKGQLGSVIGYRRMAIKRERMSQRFWISSNLSLIRVQTKLPDADI